MQVELQVLPPSPQAFDSCEVSDSTSSSVVTSSNSEPDSPQVEGSITIEEVTAALPLEETSASPPPTATNSANGSSVNAGFKIVFDNVDSTIQPRQMRIDSKSKLMHYVLGYALLDRIDFSYEPDKRSGATNLYDILPSENDYELLKEHFSVLVARIIVSYLDFFKDDFKSVVVKHIPHKHSKEMKMKSEVVRFYLSIGTVSGGKASSHFDWGGGGTFYIAFECNSWHLS